MKKTALFFFFISLITIYQSYSQAPGWEGHLAFKTNQPTSIEVINYQNDEIIYQINYNKKITIGDQDFTSIGMATLFVKMKENGTIVSSTQLNRLDNFVEITELKVDSIGGICLLILSKGVTYNNQTLEESRHKILKYSPDLELLLEKNIDQPSFSMQLGENGNFYVASQLYDQEELIPLVSIQKYESTGNIIWKKDFKNFKIARFFYSDASHLLIHMLPSFNPNQIYEIGDSVYVQKDGSYLLSLSNTGVIIKSKQIDTGKNSFNINSAIYYQDQLLLLGNSFTSFDFDSINIGRNYSRTHFILSLDHNFHLQWNLNFYQENDNYLTTNDLLTVVGDKVRLELSFSSSLLINQDTILVSNIDKITKHVFFDLDGKYDSNHTLNAQLVHQNALGNYVKLNKKNVVGDTSYAFSAIYSADATQVNEHLIKDYSGEIDLFDFIQNDDSTVITYSHVDQYSSFYGNIDNKGVIAKHDKTGALLWKHVFDKIPMHHEVSILKAKNGDYLITAFYKDDEKAKTLYAEYWRDHKFIFTLRINTEGVVLWETELPVDSITSRNKFPIEADIDNEGNYFIACDSDGISNLLKIDKFGSIIWHKKYHSRIAESNSIRIDQFGNSYLLINSGRRYQRKIDTVKTDDYSHIRSDEFLNEVTLFKTDPDGKTLWAKSIIKNDAEVRVLVYDMEFNPDGNLIIYAGSMKTTTFENEEHENDPDLPNTSYGESFFFLYTLDQNGNSVDYFHLNSNPMINHLMNYNSFDIDEKGNLYFLTAIGNLHHADGAIVEENRFNYKLYLVKLDPNYQLKWSIPIDVKSLTIEMRYLKVIKENTFAFTLDKGKEIGIGPFEYDPSFRSHHEIFFISPDGTIDVPTTPAPQLKHFNDSNQFYLLASETMDKIELYDLNGKRINSSSNQNQISLQGIAQGVYIVKMTKGNEVNQIKFFK